MVFLDLLRTFNTAKCLVQIFYGKCMDVFSLIGTFYDALCSAYFVLQLCIWSSIVWGLWLYIEASTCHRAKNVLFKLILA